MASVILFNANVITLDPSQPKAELVAIDGGRIAYVSGNEALAHLKKPGTQIIDCKGRTLLPGFIDGHCHLRAYAESLVSLNLSPRENIRSISEIQRAIDDACRHQPEGTWIKGKGYSEFHLAERRHPNRHDLDAVSPLHPVKLTHRSGHAHVLNSVALKQLGITAATEEPPEGLMDRDVETGEPNGIFYGMGSFLTERMPSENECVMRQGMTIANEKLLSCGITSIQDASSANTLGQWKQFASMKAYGIMQPRLNMMLGWKGFCENKGDLSVLQSDSSDLRLGGVKLIAGQVSGSLYPGQEELNAQVLAIHEAGLQAVIHAVETPMIEAAVKAIAHALERHPKSDHRHRIEHCSVCPPSLQRSLVELGITVVTQPSFIYYSGDRYLETVPENELEDLYPIGSLLQSGAAIGFSSDFPVSDPNPLVGIGAAVTRLSESGREVLPQQKITILDALRLYTIGSAAAAFEEGMKGSISRGKSADLVLLSDDPCQVEANRIKNIEVVMTILDGKIVWQEKSSSS
jgi:predicted amidohydrolase YtcJ